MAGKKGQQKVVIRGPDRYERQKAFKRVDRRRTARKASNDSTAESRADENRNNANKRSSRLPVPKDKIVKAFTDLLVYDSEEDRVDVTKMLDNPIERAQDIMMDIDGRIRVAMLWRALDVVMNKPTFADPLTWAEFAADLILRIRNEGVGVGARHLHLHAVGERDKGAGPLVSEILRSVASDIKEVKGDGGDDGGDTVCDGEGVHK